MIKLVDWNKLKANLYDAYTKKIGDTVIGIRKGQYEDKEKLKLIVLTRYMKTIDLQNVKADDIQLANNFKDYDEVVIDHCLKRINMILNTSFDSPIVYNEQLDNISQP